MANSTPDITPPLKPISSSLATELVKRHLDPQLTVTDVRRHQVEQVGSQRGHVVELVLSREPGSILAHCVPGDQADALRTRAQRLNFYRKHSDFPVADPLALIENDPSYPGAIQLLGMPKATLYSEARLSQAGQASFQTQLAHSLAQLHKHRGERFGSAINGQTYPNWIEAYCDKAKQTLEATRQMLPSSDRVVLDHVAANLDDWLTRDAEPALIHGDLRPDHILLDDARPNEPKLLGFTNPQAVYADPEIELAQLQLSGLAGFAFFEVYGTKHTIDAGYMLRSRVYGLVMLLERARQQGEQYVPQCIRVAEELRRLAR